ncbi:MAG: polysaccharide biosynthesis C-terminal domain-containing protein [Flavobacteriales bacterium]|nr:polysaccharide biosynthesis C-terminal domain-containing protein [Flavobacteriales bacterium]
MFPKKLHTIFFNLLRNFAPSLFNFGIAIIGVQYCGTENWGELVSILITLFIVNFIANWGNQEYLIRAYSKKPNSILNLYFSSLTTRSLFLVLSLGFFFYYSASIAMLGIALIVVQFIYNSLGSLIIYHQKFKSQLLAEFLGFLVIFLAISFNRSFSVSYFLIAYLVSFLLKLSILIPLLKLFPKKGMMQFNKTYILEMAPFFLIGLSGWMQSKVDLYIVDYFLTPSDLAQYQLVITAFIMLLSISALLTQPFSKHLYRINEQVILKIRKLVSWAGLPITIVGSWVIWYFLENYTVVHLNVNVYWMLALSIFPPFLYAVDILNYYKRKEEKKVMKITFIGALINLILTLILTPTYGIFGATIGVCIAKWTVLVIYKIKNVQRIAKGKN